jgi:hypothetical protein
MSSHTGMMTFEADRFGAGLMAEPQLPVVPGMELPFWLIAKDQPEYKTLPAYIYDDGPCFRVGTDME